MADAIESGAPIDATIGQNFSDRHVETIDVHANDGNSIIEIKWIVRHESAVLA